ncbi:MAG: carboxypeptidase regulatory-like domain-containing protein [Kofleriaceae bacterium]|nr:carboxypeptidase regulatory-like domain-containing protein [Kofleriaceae bacterium]MCB9572075.1 carboxypeptidase regulatory-like domain-containing protein [Kofleriaceae bacterium]
MSSRGLFAGVLCTVALAWCALGCDPGSINDGPLTLDDGGTFICVPETAPAGDGHHNEGQACLTSGCHRNSGGPAFTVAGTVYDIKKNGLTVPGATIVVIDGDGKEVRIPTAQNGNFWTSEPLSPPLYVRASQCPNDRRMVSLSQDGDCNAGQCHSAAEDRIFLYE